MTLWLARWRQNGWRLIDGSQVKNKVDFEKLYKESIDMDVKWVN